MKKYIFFSVLILFFFQLFPLNFSDNIYTELYSYHGSQYFPNQEKEYNYLQETQFTIGNRFPLTTDLVLNLRIGYRHNYFEENIFLDSLSIVRNWYNSSFGFKIYDKKIGKYSYIQNIDVNNCYFNKGILENYRFSGFNLHYDFLGFLWETELGGNQLNRILASTKFIFEHHPILFNIGLFHSGRSNYNNQKEITFSSEGKFLLNRSQIYLTTSYHSFLSSERFKNTQLWQIYVEGVFPVYKNILLGNAYFYKWHCKDNWEKSYIFFNEFPIQQFTHNFLFNYKETNFYINRKYTSILNFEVASKWDVGLNFSYFYPSVGIDYYEFGLQTTWNYHEN
ncbi:MAG: hypothetical protein SVM86_00785 [Candidatus Cloacimonadota bacterium]|nr:hypothetical protein [Candidatus Cloacimonadota bacterium]